MNRLEIADLLLARLEECQIEMRNQYQRPGNIKYFLAERMLPEEVATEIYNAFPKPQEMMIKRNLREYKHTTSQMNQYDKLLEEVTYAFQDSRIVSFVKNLVGVKSLLPDVNLYAGGISSMCCGNYLNPHLDNSHDKDRKHWRVLNLLYYVTPNWDEKFGGNLELWPEGPRKKQITIHSKFNRLVIMVTHQESWHSVSPVSYDGVRCCISNYYFSDNPIRDTDKFHVTSFRGRPEQLLRDVILQADAKARMGIRRIFKRGIRENPHVYKKD